MTEKQKRRFKKVGVSRELLHGELFRESREKRWKRITKGVPRDAEFQSLHHEPSRDTWWAVFSHPDWEHIDIGENIPELVIEVEEVTAEEKMVLY